MPEPNNSITVEAYREIEQTQAFNLSCINLLTHREETKKLNEVLAYVKFSKVPKAIQDQRMTIYLGMDGCCRNHEAVQRAFKKYRVIVVDSS